jgi:hypothetical protein
MFFTNPIGNTQTSINLMGNNDTLTIKDANKHTNKNQELQYTQNTIFEQFQQFLNIAKTVIRFISCCISYKIAPSILFSYR